MKSGVDSRDSPRICEGRGESARSVADLRNPRRICGIRGGFAKFAAGTRGSPGRPRGRGVRTRVRIVRAGVRGSGRAARRPGAAAGSAAVRPGRPGLGAGRGRIEARASAQGDRRSGLGARDGYRPRPATARRGPARKTRGSRCRSRRRGEPCVHPASFARGAGGRRQASPLRWSCVARESDGRVNTRFTATPCLGANVLPFPFASSFAPSRLRALCPSSGERKGAKTRRSHEEVR